MVFLGDLPSTPRLTFSDRCIGDDGARQLVEQLAVRDDVTELDLRGCHLHASGAAALAGLLLDSAGKAITSLSLEWNSLGTSDAGPRSLARTLAANCSLMLLDLRNNRIGATAVSSLAEGLQRNRTLTTLDLRWNSAGQQGALALEAALRGEADQHGEGAAGNFTLLRLPLQGNRVPDELTGRIQKLLNRNAGGGESADAAKENEGGLQLGGIKLGAHLLESPVRERGPATYGGGQPLRDAVHSRTLESAMALQQAEFANKLKHATQRAETAEAGLEAERSRADVSSQRAISAQRSEADTAAQLALLEQDRRHAREVAEAEVATAMQKVSNAEHAAARADAARDDYADQLRARDERIAAELKAIAEREARAEAAEARAIASAQQLAELNDVLLAERREHAAAVSALNEKLSAGESLRTQLELKLASADSARASGISASVAQAEASHAEAEAALRAEMGRLEALATAAEEEKTGLRLEVGRVRAEADARLETSEKASREREAKSAEKYEARLEELAGEMTASASAHREALSAMRTADDERQAAHDAKLAAAREAAAEAEQRGLDAVAAEDAASREVVRLKAEMTDAAVEEASLREQLSRAQALAVEQEAEAKAELGSMKRSMEEKLNNAMADNAAISRQLLDTKHKLQGAQAKYENELHSLQHSVVQMFQEHTANASSQMANLAASPSASRSAGLAASSSASGLKESSSAALMKEYIKEASSGSSSPKAASAIPARVGQPGTPAGPGSPGGPGSPLGGRSPSSSRSSSMTDLLNLRKRLAADGS